MIVLFFTVPSLAQPFAQDSSRVFVKQDTAYITTPKWQPVPKKAALFSTFVPGLGQIYNKKYWKAPIVYAGITAGIYFINFNQRYFKEFKTAYILREDQDSATVDIYDGRYSSQQLSIATEYYRRNRDLSIVITSAIYILNIVDAYVDAHLFSFDVDDKLSIQWQPSLRLVNTYAGRSGTIPQVSFTFFLH